MPKKKDIPSETPSPGKVPEVLPPIDPEELPIPEEDPDVIPEEEPNEAPPYEIPPPGEGP